MPATQPYPKPQDWFLDVFHSCGCQRQRTFHLRGYPPSLNCLVTPEISSAKGVSVTRIDRAGENDDRITETFKGELSAAVKS